MSGRWTRPWAGPSKASEPEVSRRILDSRERLLARLDECDGPGHESGLVVIKLRRLSFRPAKSIVSLEGESEGETPAAVCFPVEPEYKLLP